MALGKESAFSTAVAYTKYVDIYKDGVTADRQIMYLDTVESRNTHKQAVGTYKVGGPIDFPIAPENCGFILLGSLGAVSSSVVNAVDKHTFTPADTITTFTLGLGGDVAAGENKLTSAFIKKLSIKAAVNEFVSGTIDVIAETSEQAAIATPTFSALTPFSFTEGDITIGGVSDTNVEAIQIDIENNVYEDGYSIGSQFLRRAQWGGLKVSGTMDLNFGSITQWKKFYDGSTGTSPATPVAPFALNASFTGPIISGSDAYQFNVLMGSVIFDTRSGNQDKQSRMHENISWTAIYNVSASRTIAIELQNEIAAY